MEFSPRKKIPIFIRIIFYSLFFFKIFWDHPSTARFKHLTDLTIEVLDLIGRSNLRDSVRSMSDNKSNLYPIDFGPIPDLVVQSIRLWLLGSSEDGHSDHPIKWSFPNPCSISPNLARPLLSNIISMNCPKDISNAKRLIELLHVTIWCVLTNKSSCSKLLFSF